jgi:hypothetical protein
MCCSFGCQTALPAISREQEQSSKRVFRFLILDLIFQVERCVSFGNSKSIGNLDTAKQRAG